MTPGQRAEVERLTTSTDSAARFIARATALRNKLQTERDTHQMVERSATRRASLDLTRSLADLRRSPYA